MCKYEMDPTSIVEDTEWTRFCPQTDRQTDELKPVYPPFNFAEAGGIIIEILTKVFCTYGPNVVTLAWTGDKLLCRQTWWRMDGWTDADNDNTWRPKQASGIKIHISHTFFFSHINSHPEISITLCHTAAIDSITYGIHCINQQTAGSSSK